MKKYIKSTVVIAICSTTLFTLLLAGCSSMNNSKKGSASYTIDIPCSNFTSSDGFLRAFASGESMDLSHSREKAFHIAETKLAGKIETNISYAVEQSIAESGSSGEINQRYQQITDSIVIQALSGVSEICSKTEELESGKYKTYISLELAVEIVLQKVYNDFLKEEDLRLDYSYPKFKKTFEEELSKGDNQ